MYDHNARQYTCYSQDGFLHLYGCYLNDIKQKWAMGDRLAISEFGILISEWIWALFYYRPPERGIRTCFNS